MSAPTTSTPRCAACGYDLAALGRDALCPECGRMNLSTDAPELLRNAGHEFLSTLARGALIIEIAWVIRMIISIASPLVSLVAMAVMLLQKVSIAVPPIIATIGKSSTQAQMLAIQSSLAIDALALGGWWLLTAPSALEVEGGARNRARSGLRVLLATFLLLELAKFIASFSPVFRSIAAGNAATIRNLSTFSAVGALVGAAIYGLAFVAQFILSMAHMRDLALRAEDDRLAAHIRTGMWALPVIAVVGMACFMLGPLVASIGIIWFVGRLRVSIAAHRDRAAPSV